MRMIVTLKSLRVIAMILEISWKTRLLMKIHMPESQDLKQMVMALFSMSYFMTSIMVLS